MAYDEVTEDGVYLCVGHPPRRDIENIVKWMLNDHFSITYNSILCALERDVVALLVGHQTCNLQVTGSSPGWAPL